VTEQCLAQGSGNL